MQSHVIVKEDGSSSIVSVSDGIQISQPSVVLLPVGPEQVARFERRGDDLVLTLRDGRIVTIGGFFLEADDGRNDLVFEDGAGVTWWAQYTSPWQSFDIAEIGGLPYPVLAPSFGGMPAGALALIGGGIAVGGMGGGSSPSREPSIRAGAGDPDLLADEAVLGAPGSADFSGLFDVRFGADGPAEDDALVYRLDVDTDVPSGLVDLLSGETVVLSVNEDGTVVTGMADGEVVFTLTLDPETGEISLDQQRPLRHEGENEPDDILRIANDAITLEATATDADGDSVSRSVSIGNRFGFDDDMPVAEDDTATVAEGSFEPVGGDLLDNDDTGADGGSLTSVRFGDITVDIPQDGTPVTIDGDYGTLTISADGSYSYARNPDSSGGVSDVFVYTLTDGDGDSDTASLTVSIGNSDVGLGGLDGEVVVNEAMLPDGTGVGTGAASVTGSFTVSAPDGIAVLRLSQNGTDYDIVLDNVAEDLPLVITTGLGNTLTITGFDPATGTVSYSYAVSEDANAHGAGEGRNDLTETLTVTLQDMDGDETTADLTLRVQDDIPVVAAGAGDPDLLADEADLGPAGSADFSGLFDVDFGADGPAEDDALVYRLDVDTDVPSGLVDLESGEAVVLSVNADGTVVTGTADGQVVFTVTLNPETGVISLNQQRPLRHEGENEPDDILRIANDAITLEVTATDADGDIVSHEVSIGNRFGFDDDMPVAVSETAVSVVEGSGAIGHDGAVWSAGTANLMENDTPGADTARIHQVRYLDPDGEERIVIIADAATGTGELDTLYGTLSVNADGTWSYRPDSGVEHPDGDPVSDLFSYTLIDGDGDVSNWADQPIWVTDTAPVAVDDLAVSVAEGGAELSGNVIDNDTPSSDGAGVLHSFTYTDTDGEEQTHVFVEGTDEVTVSTPTGDLTIDINGDWRFEPLSSFDHGAEDADPDAGSFRYVLVDADGSLSNPASQPITVTDTVPAVGTPENAAVDERHLPLGSDPDAGELQASGSLGLLPGQDSFDTRLTTTPGGLTSGGVPLEYVLAEDGHSLVAYRGEGRGDGDRVFTVELTDPTEAGAGYSFTLHSPLDHDGAPDLDLGFGFTVTDSDGDEASGNFVVTVADDVPVEDLPLEVPEDGEITFNTSADATPGNTTIWMGGDELTGTPNADGGLDFETPHGSLTLNADGSITYRPAPDFSGEEVFEYRTDDGGDITTTTVTLTVTPVADPADLDVIAANINTLEDSVVGLGLQAPVVSDDGTGDGNNPTPERLGRVTLSGFPEGAVLLDGDGNPLHTFDASGAIVIDLSGLSQIDDGTAGLTMTPAEFEALQVLPPLHDATNFTVTVSVTSYEVDEAGERLPGIDGAVGTASVTVFVQGVTDDAELIFDEEVTAEEAGVDALVFASGTEASVTIAEDARFNLKTLLSAGFADLDGSEEREILITNGSDHPIMVGTTEVPAGGNIVISATGQTGDIGSFPDILLGGVGDFSGDLEGIEITLVARDIDADGYWDEVEGQVIGGPVNGVAEADTSNNSVTLNLYVTPVAGDVVAGDVSVAEDTAVAFMQHVRVTDTDGTEVITELSFTVPDGWVIGVPDLDMNDAVWTWEEDGNDRTITFTAGSQAEREEVLSAFTIRPPAHSSHDTTIDLEITTVDSQIVNEVPVTVDATVTRSVEIEVTPVAERVGVDSDGDGTVDLTMTPGHVYVTAGDEDQWFTLGTEGVFNLGDGWSNQDADEIVFARLTPELIAGDGSLPDAIGSEFRWQDEGGEWVSVTYTGEPVDVPVGFLDTLEFRAAPDFSGMFRVRVQAYTVDYDDTTEGVGTPATAVSGEAFLTNLLVRPAADEVTMALTARASGLEDTPIPLTIRPTSSDPSETFTVTIADIPVGATLRYGEVEFVATEGDTSFEISNFDSATPLSLTPPLDSNTDFTLSVSAKSVDILTIGETTYTSESELTTLSIDVAVRGVADEADVVTTDRLYTEAELDSGDASVLLRDLVTVALADTDGSETLTVRVFGLPDEFSPTVGTLLTGPEITGTERVWVLTTAQLEDATINVPANYSGTVEFRVAAVTTENDGNSRTGAAHWVRFDVTPSPEGTVTTSAELVEDELSLLGLSIVHQNGDLDESLHSVRIRVEDAETATFTLFLGTGAEAETLADSGVPVEIDGGVEYYLLTAEQVQQLSALGHDHLDGDLGGFNLQYRISDANYGGAPAGAETVSDWQDDYFTLSAAPVTDQPVLTITSITGSEETTTVADDTATLGAVDIVTVTLNIASPDHDGSEKLIRVVIEGVPDGVAVIGADMIGAGSWLLVYEGGEQPINAAGGIDLPVQFDVSAYAHGVEDARITMTAQVQDRAEDSDTEVLSASAEWGLVTGFAPGSGLDPATITQWEYTGASATEDSAFSLSEMIDAAVTLNSSAAPNVFTVMLTGLPEGTTVAGMTRTVIDGETVWSASAVSATGATQADIDALLADLMDGIVITPPEHANDNNLPGGFNFSATLSAAVLGGPTAEPQTITPDIPVIPVTDPALIALGLDAPEALDESSTVVPLSLTISNPADGAAASIVDGMVYLRIASTEPGLNTGELVVDGVPYALSDVSGVEGVPDGQYYVIPEVQMGDTLALDYTPGTVVAGEISVDVWLRNTEAEADGPVTSQGGLVVPIQLSNDGAEIVSAPVTGREAADATSASLIELTGLSVSLNDDDGSEEIVSILLANLPDGFLVMTGADAGSATNAGLASNAGGSGGMNTWVIAGPGEPMPPYVGILPPQYWSGTLDDLRLIVTSGETALGETRTDTATLAPVTIEPVANGIALTATNTFGTEGTIVPLNLNASMADPADVSVVAGGDTIAQDASVETVTLELTGLGAFASFYVGDALVEGVSYDGEADIYTLTGLSQTDIDQLGFRQARDALTDQAPASGVQLGVTAWTVDGEDTSDPVSTTITVNLGAQLATTGNDTLIWTGGAINGRAGEDTILVRHGESLTGAELAARLSNIEVLDLGVAGANGITDLSPETVASITDGRNELRILGDGSDSVTLAGDWQDNGDGSFTGVIGAGTVTLIVEPAVGVIPPAGGFSGGPVGFGGFAESFGLASIGMGEGGAQDGVAASGGDKPDYDALFGQPEAASVEDLLPGADGDAAPGGGAAQDQGDFGPEPIRITPWDNDLQEAPHY